MKKIILLLLIIIFLASCIPGDGKHTVKKPAGILWGIWHGWIAPISLIVGIFNPAIRVYETNNDLCDTYEHIFDETKNHKAFYVHKFRTVYISFPNVSECVLAHEIGHAIIDSPHN